MAFTTSLKDKLNLILSSFNLRIGTLTLERAEIGRLLDLEAVGHFQNECFPLPEAIRQADFGAVLAELSTHAERFRTFTHAQSNDVGFVFDNGYFGSPDAEVLYLLTRRLKPRLIIEVGSGNSTKVSRQAIIDGKLSTDLISIDPEPRTDVVGMAGEILRERVESDPARKFLQRLQGGDILFIDSSHQIKPGNDVVYLLLKVLPDLPVGVYVHIHDIFLPYEYPRTWLIEQRWDWTEQYLVQAMLAFGDTFEVIWPGHYLQRTMSDFGRYFPHSGTWLGSSLWLRKLK